MLQKFSKQINKSLKKKEKMITNMLEHLFFRYHVIHITVIGGLNYSSTCTEK